VSPSWTAARLPDPPPPSSLRPWISPATRGRPLPRPTPPPAEPPDGWTGAVVAADRDPEGAWSFCRTVRKRDVPLAPLLLLVSGAQLADLELRDDLFDDFLPRAVPPRELEARLKHLFWKKAAAPGRSCRVRAARLNLEPTRPTSAPSARSHLHGVRAAEVPGPAPGQGVHREILLSRVGATSTTAALAPSTSTSGGCGPSSARSTPTSSRRALGGLPLRPSRWSA